MGRRRGAIAHERITAWTNAVAHDPSVAEYRATSPAPPGSNAAQTTKKWLAFKDVRWAATVAKLLAPPAPAPLLS